MDSILEANKGTVTAFYDLMFNQCRPPKQSSGMSARPTCSTIRWWPMARRRLSPTLSGWRRSIPANASSLERVIAEGDYVVLHCHQHWPGDGDWAGIDIFRLDEHGKIVEHWDVLPERVPETSLSKSEHDVLMLSGPRPASSQPRNIS